MSQKLPEWLGKKRIINHHFENQKSHVNIMKGNTTNQKGKNHNQQLNL